MLKILQARLQQYVNCELPVVQAGFRKRQRNQRSNCQHPLDHWKSKRVPGKHLLILYWLCQSLWLGDHNKLEHSSIQFSSVQSLSRVRLFTTQWITAHQASLSITISRNSFRLTSIESVMPSSHLILGRPLLLLPPIPPSIRVFSNESTLLMRCPKYWIFSFRKKWFSSKEIPRLISFRMDWLDLLAVQGALKSLLQHHSSKASILRCSAFFTVQIIIRM